jgi:hypothetical protein
VKATVPSVSNRIGRADEEDASLDSVSTAAPGISVSLHCIQGTLKADARRGGSSLIVCTSLENQRCGPS